MNYFYEDPDLEDEDIPEEGSSDGGDNLDIDDVQDVVDRMRKQHQNQVDGKDGKKPTSDTTNTDPKSDSAQRKPNDQADTTGSKQNGTGGSDTGSLNGTEPKTTGGATPTSTTPPPGAEAGAAETAGTTGTAAAETGAGASASAGAGAGASASAGAGAGAAATGTGAAAAGTATAAGTAGAGAAAGTAAGAAAGAGLVATPVGWIILIVLLVIILIIILTGVIMFFATVPGMVIDQLKQYFSNMADSIAIFFGSDSTEQVIEDQEIYDVMDYLEQMGYDLKGYGFISKDADSTDANYDERTGVIRDPETGLIDEAHSDIIRLYIMSDNYIYTISNFNFDPDAIIPVIKWIQAAAMRFASWADFLNILDSTTWGKGMISLYYESGGQLGVPGADYQNGILGWEEISINPGTKKLKIRRSGWFADYYEYNMDGWAGRYGMPLDFLLSLHIATQKPDLTYDMVTSFGTDVQILLRDIKDAEQAACYKTSSGSYIYYSTVEEATRLFRESETLVEELLAWLDDIVMSAEEAKTMFDLGFDHASSCECTYDEETGEIATVGDSCKNLMKEILSELKTANTYEFDTYIPYIAKVKDHWFRDVYFVLSSSEASTVGLISTDGEYEAFSGERWTLYETYTEAENPERANEYKLYKYDSSKEGGFGELFDGTQEEANEEGIKVIKKPVKTYIEDLVDQGVVKDETLKSDGSWSAYKANDYEGSPERVYPDAEPGSVKERIYIKITMSSSVAQIEDGVRGETNDKIKKMFLENQYFSYDGSSETAEKIKEVRDALGMEYGPVSEDDLEKELKADLGVELEEDNGDTPMKVSNLTSTVSLTQESLNAFSMLENTHTEDADFIYRDFKELIVELGYFTKEELTDTTPKLLQWIIPDIGSAGFPKRALDKDENFFGTLAHSKEDYEANEKDTIQAKLDAFYKTQPEVDPSNTDLGRANTNSNLTNVGIAAQLANRNLDLTTVGIGVSDLVEENNRKDRSLSGVTVNEFLTKAREICEYMDQVGYDYCVNRPVEVCTTCQGCTIKCGCPDDVCSVNHCNHEVKGNSCHLPLTFEESKGITNVCCATLVSWVLRDVGVNMDDCSNPHGAQSIAEYCVEQLGGKVITSYSELKPGDILAYVRPGGGDIGHVDILGEKEGGEFVRYNGGHAVSATNSSIGTFNQGQFDSNDLCFGIRLFGASEEGEYEGFLGDEAVVSPVTGILLEYGTYDENTEEETNDILNELVENTAEYRTNIDKPEKVDKVGYAKILVLNEEIGDQIVTCDEHYGEPIDDDDEYEAEEGIITIPDPQSPEDMDDWSEARLGLYGYKIFKEDYEKGGIAGYMIYIDGFKCELPGEGIDEETDIDTYDPGNGTELTYEYFLNHAASGGGRNGTYFETSYGESLYEADEVYKLVSEKIEEKQRARSDAKAAASTLYKFNGSYDGEEQELLIIKEGTVLGRTLTNKELVEDYRGETYVKPEEPEEGEEDTREVQGNYIRVIMKAPDDEVVEDVEDYMKLDELNSNKTQEYVAQPGDLQLLANLLHHEGCENYFTSLLGGDRERGQAASRVTGYVLINRALANYGGHGTTIREQILAPGQYSTAEVVTEGEDVTCAECLANAEWCLTYDCSSTTNPEGDPMPRDIFGQSGWCQCNGTKFSCWWWVDSTGDGSRTESNATGTIPYDTFFCK